jgi:hypothetical protein
MATKLKIEKRRDEILKESSPETTEDFYGNFP